MLEFTNRENSHTGTASIIEVFIAMDGDGGFVGLDRMIEILSVFPPYHFDWRIPRENHIFEVRHECRDWADIIFDDS